MTSDLDRRHYAVLRRLSGPPKRFGRIDTKSDVWRVLVHRRFVRRSGFHLRLTGLGYLALNSLEAACR